MASSNSIGRVSSVFRQNLFKNRMAIVTGGATGIGKAITLELLHLGCKVVIASRNEDRLKEACQQMNSAFPSKSQIPSVTAIKCNIRQEDQVKELFEKSLSIYGHLDFVVNNGGGQFISPAADLSLKGWNAVVETNLTGTFLMCREAYNTWMKDNGGSIVNIIMETRRGFAAMAHSSAARAGVGTLIKSLAIEWAHSGVRVNAVTPGSNIYSETAAANYGDPHIFDAHIPTIPTKRLGLPEEISGAVCFLLSPAASFITGESITVDGGQYLYSPQFWDIPDHKKLPAYDWKTDNDDGQ